MCNNPYMLLSHYEILAWGTALWKLLHLTVCSGPINKPLHWMTECVPSRQHMSAMIERRGEESRLDQRGRLPLLYYYLQSLQAQAAGSEAGSDSLSGWTVPLQPPYCCPQYGSLHLLSFLSHHLQGRYSASFGFFVGLTTHFPAPVH